MADNTSWLPYFREAGRDASDAALAGRDADLTPFIVDHILSVIPISARDRLLDVGCGDALVLRRALATERAGTVSSVEERDALLAKQAAGGSTWNTGEPIVFYAALADALPLPDGWATRLVCNGVFLVLPSREFVARALAEFRRVTAPQGLVYVGEIPAKPAGFMGLLKRPFEILETHGAAELARRVTTRYGRARSGQLSASKPGYVFLTPDDMRAMAAQAGFDVVEWHRLDLRHNGRRLEYPRNRYNYLLRAGSK